MRTFKTKPRNGALVVGARIGPPESNPPMDAEKHILLVFVSNPRTRIFWDDFEALLYCDHQFDRQFAISLS
jgi:hypothetical protein